MASRSRKSASTENPDADTKTKPTRGEERKKHKKKKLTPEELVDKLRQKPGYVTY